MQKILIPKESLSCLSPLPTTVTSIKGADLCWEPPGPRALLPHHPHTLGWPPNPAPGGSPALPGAPSCASLQETEDGVRVGSTQRCPRLQGPGVHEPLQAHSCAPSPGRAEQGASSPHPTTGTPNPLSGGQQGCPGGTLTQQPHPSRCPCQQPGQPQQQEQPPEGAGSPREPLSRTCKGGTEGQHACPVPHSPPKPLGKPWQVLH